MFFIQCLTRRTGSILVEILVVDFVPCSAKRKEIKWDDAKLERPAASPALTGPKLALPDASGSLDKEQGLPQPD
jgi:hypothetical protein